MNCRSGLGMFLENSTIVCPEPAMLGVSSSDAPKCWAGNGALSSQEIRLKENIASYCKSTEKRLVALVAAGLSHYADRN